MQINQFPYQFELQRKQQAQNESNNERNRSASRQNTIRNSITSTVNVGAWSSTCGGIGFVVGFFVCCGVLGTDHPGPDTVGNSFMTWVVMSIGGLVLGAILAGLINSGHNSSIKNADREIIHEKERCEKAIQEFHAQAAKEIAVYQAEFEAEAQRMSVRFAESALATEVINWMTDGFSRTIDATDRRCHIEKINVPFSFNVYTNKITCNLGTYDFEIKRCANLTSPLQQTAIARAIATAIQLNITMKYPKDASGTGFVLNNSYSYTEDHVSVAITYSAPNGNYRSVQSW